MERSTLVDRATVRREELRQFLRSRRALVMPAEVGILTGPRRRAKGLRREELAVLAGISVTWYTWLEQAREVRASADALERLAQAMRLSATDTAHLFALADVQRPDRIAGDAKIDISLQPFVDGFTVGPAIVVNACWDVLHYNSLANIIFEYDHAVGPFGHNQIWRLFMLSQYRTIFVDWKGVAASTVGLLRLVRGRMGGASRAGELVDVLLAESNDFATLWANHATSGLAPVQTVLRPGASGADIRFDVARFSIGPDENRLLVLLAPSEATDAVKVEALRSLFLPNH